MILILGFCPLTEGPSDPPTLTPQQREMILADIHRAIREDRERRNAVPHHRHWRGREDQGAMD